MKPEKLYLFYGTTIPEAIKAQLTESINSKKFVPIESISIKKSLEILKNNL